MTGFSGTPPRVGHVCRQFSKPSETFILQTVRLLVRAGVDSRVYTRRRIGPAPAEVPEPTLYPESVLEELRFGVNKKLLNRYRLRFPVSAMAKDLRAHDRNLLHAHFGGTALAMLPVLRAAGLPMVATFHAFDLYTRCFPPDVYQDLWPHLDRAVAISQAGAERLESRFGCPADKIRIVHCGIDLDRFPYREPRVEEGPANLIGIGRLVAKKGIDVLLRALVLTREIPGFPDWRLTWYGEGPLGGTLLCMARELGLDEQVVFAGGVDHGNVPGLLRDADMLMLPSRTAENGDTEGIPITLLEAGASGCETVATLHGGVPEGLPETLRSGLVPEDDPEALAWALADRLSNRADWPERSRQARRHVEAQFSLEAECRSLLEVYREATG